MQFGIVRSYEHKVFNVYLYEFSFRYGVVQCDGFGGVSTGKAYCRWANGAECYFIID